MWYKNYYSDFYYSNTLKNIHTLEKLINIYFLYGLFFKNNSFLSSFWYKNYFSKNYNTVFSSKNMALYFRKYYYAHKTLAIEHSYFIRLKTPEFFPLRLYVLKYNNWLVASIQWFKPWKNTLNKSLTKSFKPGTTPLKRSNNLIMFSNGKLSANNSKLVRLKVVLNLLKNSLKLLYRQGNYTF